MSAASDADAVARFTTADGLSLAYRDEGAGPAVLCLPGLTRNMADFEPVARRYAARARIVRMDKRGRGLSDHDPDPMNYTIPTEAGDALALLDHLGIDRAAIIGTSRGGLIAMVIAAQAKERLTGVLLNDIGPVIEPEGLQFISTYIGVTPTFGSYDEAVETLMVVMKDRFPRATRETWRAHAERTWAEGENGLALRYDPDLRRPVVESDTGAVLPDPWPLFESLSGLPLALLRAENSDILGRETAAEMQRRRPDMIYAEVPGTGHVPFLDEPESRAVIEAFLDRLEA